MAYGDSLLAAGPPPLTQSAADCALDLIDFMAAVVRGVDLIDVTEEMRQIWRNYLATYYPQLAPADRYWFANAPATLSQLNVMWPQMPAVTREMWRQTWAMSLPATLQFIQPVLEAAQQQQVWHLSHLTDSVPQNQPTASDGGASAIQELNRMQNRAANLMNFSTNMTKLTINQMNVMSGRLPPYR
jgi:hypothetical protein